MNPSTVNAIQTGINAFQILTPFAMQLAPILEQVWGSRHAPTDPADPNVNDTKRNVLKGILSMIAAPLKAVATDETYGNVTDGAVAAVNANGGMQVAAAAAIAPGLTISLNGVPMTIDGKLTIGAAK